MPDLVIVLVVVLVLVLLWRGPKTLPQLGQALGRGVKEARSAARDDDEIASETTAAGRDHAHAAGHDHDHGPHDHDHAATSGSVRRD